MKIWFTSDLHFGHRNIIKYCHRPFDSVDEMDNELIKLWNDTVDEEDGVVVRKYKRRLKTLIREVNDLYDGMDEPSS